MKKNKNIETQRIKAVIEDMKIQAKKMERISRPKRFIDKLVAFGRMRIIAQIMLTDIQIEHTERQTEILQGKYDDKLRTIISELAI